MGKLGSWRSRSRLYGMVLACPALRHYNSGGHDDRRDFHKSDLQLLMTPCKPDALLGL
jgi:hypothetical protein